MIIYTNLAIFFIFLLQGFDEFMNLVRDDTVEVNYKKNTRRELGRILLKGDNITLVSALETTA